MKLIREWFRTTFAPIYCEKESHRWVFSSGMEMYRCKDCWKYIPRLDEQIAGLK